MLTLHTYLPKPQANAEVNWYPDALTRLSSRVPPHVPWNLELIALAVASRPSTNAASHCALVDQVCLVSMSPFSQGEQAQSFLTKSLDSQSFGVSPSLHDSNVHTHTSMYIISKSGKFRCKIANYRDFCRTTVHNTMYMHGPPAAAHSWPNWEQTSQATAVIHLLTVYKLHSKNLMTTCCRRHLPSTTTAALCLSVLVPVCLNSQHPNAIAWFCSSLYYDAPSHPAITFAVGRTTGAELLHPPSQQPACCPINSDSKGPYPASL